MSNHNEAGSPTRRDEGSSAGCLALQSGEEVTLACVLQYQTPPTSTAAGFLQRLPCDVMAAH